MSQQLSPPRAVAGAVSRELGDGESIVLLGERAIVLNAVGTAVWHLLDGSRDLADIVEIIAERFDDIDPDRITADVAALLERLAGEGLVE